MVIDDKYKLHDLRKDPADLPPKTMKCIIYTMHDSVDVATYYKDSFGSGWIGVYRKSVIAWREVIGIED